jgi:hypothetical protein
LAERGRPGERGRERRHERQRAMVEKQSDHLAGSGSIAEGPLVTPRPGRTAISSVGR